jgi:hypothetical protein
MQLVTQHGTGLAVVEMIKKFPVHHRVHKTHHCIINYIRSTDSLLVSQRHILILSSYLHLSIPNGHFLWRFPTRILYSLSSPCVCSILCPFHFFACIWTNKQQKNKTAGHNTSRHARFSRSTVSIKLTPKNTKRTHHTRTKPLVRSIARR